MISYSRVQIASKTYRFGNFFIVLAVKATQNSRGGLATCRRKRIAIVRRRDRLGAFQTTSAASLAHHMLLFSMSNTLWMDDTQEEKQANNHEIELVSSLRMFTTFSHVSC
jgi:hypothetical protein